MDGLIDFGIQFIQSIQTWGTWLEAPMEAITFIGTVNFYILFITYIFWVVDYKLGFRTFLVLIGVDIVSSGFKQLLHQPRPYWLGGVRHVGEELTYGIPSSHASDSLTVWGYLAFRTRKSWITWLAIALILLIAFSRPFLGVHFPHDILGGWIIGAVVLFLILRYEQQFKDWISTKTDGYQIGLGFVISLIFILEGFLILALIDSSPDPDSWASFATEARSPSHYFTLGGALFGAVSGFIMMRRGAPFKNGGAWILKIARYLLGVVGVFAILFGLDAVFAIIASDETALGYILRYIRYGSVTFWAFFIAPWVFLKTRLAEKA